jgi:hypothetical protein
MTLPTSGGRSVGIVRSRTQTMEFLVLVKSKLLFSYCGYYIIREFNIFLNKKVSGSYDFFDKRD